jgi:ribosomal protein S27AE
MPCYRCGTRQVDPDRGPSPWKRGVRGDRQVLICPDCQEGRNWAADLDRCGRCGTVRLVRRLGEVECRDCGQIREPAPASAGAAVGVRQGPPAIAAEEGSPAAGDLAEEVARALDRVLGRHRAAR